MSWLYFPAQAVDYSPVDCSDGALSVTSKTIHSASMCSKQESVTDISTTPLSGTTLSHSTGVPGLDVWISSLRDSRASRSVSPEPALQKTTRVTDGRQLSESFARYDPDTHSWKTSQDSFLGLISDEYSGNWPKQATISNMIAYRRKKSALPTGGNVSGLLPTPLARPGMRLQWPTPTVQDAKNNGSVSQMNRNSLPLNAIVKLFPTPVASGKLNGETRDYLRLKSLEQLHHITVEERRSMAAGNGGKLNPDWVEWLMGWPIGWSALEPLATDRYQEWLQRHGGYCHE
jgi:hypothetical protein